MVDKADVGKQWARIDHGVSKQIGLFTHGRRIETRRQRAGLNRGILILENAGSESTQNVT